MFRLYSTVLKIREASRVGFQVACFRRNVTVLKAVGGRETRRAVQKRLEQFALERANLKRPTIPGRGLLLDCLVRANFLFFVRL